MSNCIHFLKMSSSYSLFEIKDSNGYRVAHEIVRASVV